MSANTKGATAHLVHGYLATGKTTFANRLAVTSGAVLFSLDEWYLRLYTDGEPTSHLDDVLDRRLRSQLDALWPQLLARGLDVVLDFGFWSRADRDRARARVESAGARPIVYSLTCEERTARRRLAARNAAGPVGSFLLTDDAYDHLRSKFDDLDHDEPRVVVENDRSSLDATGKPE